MDSSVFIVLLIAIGVFVLWIYIKKNFKFPKVGSMVMVDGAVKSGKTTFAFGLAIATYKRAVRRWKIRKFFRKIFDRAPEEKPLFYSSMPVDFEYVPLTRELLLRKERFAYKSVIFVDEASLFADSTLVKDSELNDDLLLFNKLIAHETQGGTIIYNSQSISDVHFSIRRCLSETFYVHSTFRWIPFFIVCTVREERYREDHGAVNVYDADVEDSLKRVIMPKSVWKKFDCYCYSVHTDDLPVADKTVKPDSLKAYEVVSFNPSHCLDYFKDLARRKKREEREAKKKKEKEEKEENEKEINNSCS